MKRLAAAILLVLLAAAAAPTRVAAAPHEPLPPSGDSNLSSAQLLGAGRALLMILAHPLVAAAVHDHSTFTKGNDSQRMQRFERTDSMVAGLMFGDSAQVERAANAIRAVHSRVHGTLHAPAAGLPAGTPYAASDPDLLRWVLA